MTPPAAGALRLLPWSTPDGRSCYLSGDGVGYVSRVADQVERVQLGMGADLLDHAASLLKVPEASAGELRYLATRLTEALSDALRIAASRGDRLDPPEYDDVDIVEVEVEDEEPS